MSTSALPAKARKAILTTVPGLKRDISPTVLTFLALRAAGLTNKDAYLIAKPSVKPDSAERYGSRLSRLHAQHVVAIRSSPDLMHSLLSDLTCLTVMSDWQQAARDRLKAAELTDKKLGRYAPDTTVNIFNAVEGMRDREPVEPKPLHERFLPAPSPEEEEEGPNEE